MIAIVLLGHNGTALHSISFLIRLACLFQQNAKPYSVCIKSRALQFSEVQFLGFYSVLSYFEAVL